MPLADFPGYSPDMVATIDTDIRAAAYQIIEAKKSTYYGIGNVVAAIVEAMGHTRQAILPVCSLVEGEYGLHDVVLGLPSLVSAKGVKIIDTYPLSIKEKEQLVHSASVVSDAIKTSVKLDENS